MAEGAEEEKEIVYMYSAIQRFVIAHDKGVAKWFWKD